MELLWTVLALVLITIGAGEGAGAGHKLKAIMLYEHENQGGRQFQTLVDQNCRNLPENWKGHASSVVLRGACVILYAEDNCKGDQAIRLEPKTHERTNLNAVYFNDLARSLKEC